METYQEKSDDPSDHYGGISRGAMNEIKDCIDALLAAVQNSEEYQEFEKYRDLLKENPELMDRVNAFRGNNLSAKSQIDTDYSCFVENKIQGILEKIDGCGKTKVAVLCDTSKNNFDSDNYSKISFVNGVNSGINEASQNIIGVVIAAEGADDPIVKYKIVKTVVTLLAVDSSCVQVFTYIS